MKEYNEGDKMQLVNVHGRPSLESKLGNRGVIETVGHGEANEGYYKVQFHAFDGFESPQKLEWVHGCRLQKL
jgi:hypothetical protein